MRKQLVRHKNRLRVLHVGTPGHDCIPRGLGLLNQGVHQGERQRPDMARLAPQVTPG